MSDSVRGKAGEKGREIWEPSMAAAISCTIIFPILVQRSASKNPNPKIYTFQKGKEKGLRGPGPWERSGNL
ncbi:hypothetical protein COCNU_contig69497594G000010 [Cocos nucifera]|nr:hypothetical protein [Cocos nucifera]